MEILLLAVRPDWFPFAAIGLALLALASAYFGWVNLQQAKALVTIVRPSQLESHRGRVVTLRGRPESLYRGSDPFFNNWLWYRKRFQEYRQRHRHGRSSSGGSWHTVRTEESNWDLTLTLEGGVEVTVDNRPTELHGTQSETQGGGFGATYRVQIEFLPKKGVPALTVCGLLSSGPGGRLGPAPKIGLLYSVHTPEEQAARERIKGWVLLAVVPAACAGFAAYLMLM